MAISLLKWAKLVVLVDNVGNKGLKPAWGWSAYVETNSWKALFDADSDPKVLEHNCRALGIDLGSLDFAILSHYHGDHYGGFRYVGRVSKKLKVYVPPGNPTLLRKWGLEPVVVNEPLEVADNAYLTGPLTSEFLGIEEQAFAFKVEGIGVIVVVGCSHPGVDRLALKATELFNVNEVYLVIGGYHEPPKEVLDNLALIAKYIAPAHCSGSWAKDYVRSKYLSKYLEVKTGLTLEFKA